MITFVKRVSNCKATPPRLSVSILFKLRVPFSKFLCHFRHEHRAVVWSPALAHGVVMLTNHRPRECNRQPLQSATVIVVTSAVIILRSSTHFKAVSSLALAKEQPRPPLHTVLYKCPNATLPNELELPNTLLEGPYGKQGENDTFGTPIFHLHTAITACENRGLELYLDLTNSTRKDDPCNYWIKSDGKFSIIDHLWIEYKRKDYCISRWGVKMCLPFTCLNCINFTGYLFEGLQRKSCTCGCAMIIEFTWRRIRV